MRLRWIGLAVAVLAVVVALWIFDRSPPSRGGVPEGTVLEGGGPAGGGPDGRNLGVAPRVATIAGEASVSGEVVDEDGTPLSEGQLVLWCLRADGEVGRIRDGVLRLSSEGRFEGPACRGEVCVELRHPSMVPAEPWSMRPDHHATLHARLLPRLWGRVVDPEGMPVGGAQVVVSHPGGDEDDPSAVLPVVASTTSTDADGEFSLARIERPPCDACQRARDACPEDDAPLPVLDRVRVTVRATGWAPGGRIVELGDEGLEAEAPAEIAVARARAAITGHVLDPAGQAPARAFVLARSQSEPSEQHRADPFEGAFAFDALGEGPYTLRAIQDGIELSRRTDVQPGDAVELPTAPLRTLELTVVDPRDRPRVGVELEGGPFADARTDARGVVRAELVAPGSYVLRVRPPGGRTEAHTLEVPPPTAEASSPDDPTGVRLRLPDPP